MPRRTDPQTIFGSRLRQARMRLGIPQDKLGTQIGLDEGCASARISRYETGTHQPPWLIVEKLAKALGVPVAFLFAEDDDLAELIRLYHQIAPTHRKSLLDQALSFLGLKT